MNASQKTTIVAEGIAIRARQMNANNPHDLSAATAEWGAWCAKHPRLVTFVSDEQFALFDRVNGASMEGDI